MVSQRNKEALHDSKIYVRMPGQKLTCGSQADLPQLPYFQGVSGNGVPSLRIASTGTSRLGDGMWPSLAQDSVVDTAAATRRRTTPL